MAQTIERFEGSGLARLQHHPYARHPIGALAMNQMTDDVERVPAAGPFVALCPRLGKIGRQRIEVRRRTGEQRDGAREVVAHRAHRTFWPLTRVAVAGSLRS